MGTKNQLVIFMRWFGPTSSIFDIVTYLFMYFIVCPAILGGSFFELNGADQLLFIGIFHAGWFIESLWSQMLVLHFLRTEKMPFLQSSASGIMTLVTTARDCSRNCFYPLPLSVQN